MTRKGTTRLALRPGDRSTRSLVEKCGDALVAVRYRYDESSLLRHTTVELVVDAARWLPERCISDPDRLVGLRIGYEETELRARLRGVQARWDPTRRLWWLRLAVVVQLGLEERIAAWEPPRVKVSNTR